ncbi:MAG: efflux RND transporter permease subunit, partial [Candidatus Binataceae bacterium]
MMIDFALDAQRTEGKTPAEAIFEGALIRFRPIMMTTMAALMGVLPIAIGVGPTASSRRPLGAAVLGGLVFSQFLTLYITPVFYTYMESFVEWIASWRAAQPSEPSAPGMTAAQQPRRRSA